MLRPFVTALLTTSIAGLTFCAQTPVTLQISSAGQTSSPPLLLHEGTDVPLTFAQDVSSKTAMVGDPVVLLLDSDLKVSGIVVAKAGSTAYAQVTKAEKSPRRGKSGQLDIRLDYLRAGKNKILLRGTNNTPDQSGNPAVVALTERFGPLGFIKNGNIQIKQGTSLTAYVANDVMLPPA